MFTVVSIVVQYCTVCTSYERVKEFLGKYYPHWVALLEQQRYGPMHELADFRDRVELAMEGIEVENRFQRVQ